MTTERDEELRDGDDLVRRDVLGQTFEALLQIEQQHAQNADGRRQPVVLSLDEATDDVRRERGDLGREARGRLRRELAMEREQHEGADGGEADGPCRELRRRDQRERVAHSRGR